MGKVICRGWQTSVSDAAQPIGIVYGRNLKKKRKEPAKRSTSHPGLGADPLTIPISKNKGE